MQDVYTYNGNNRPSAKPDELASNTSATPIPPTSGTPNVSKLTPQILSTSGAFNGTSLATFNIALNQELVTHLFYQDYQGQLRRVEKDGSQWSGGPAIAAVVSSNAKNATPIACANYTDTTTNAPKVRLPALLRLDRSTDVPIQANLFYVDPTNVLQEVISTDNFQTWQTGNLQRGKTLMITFCNYSFTKPLYLHGEVEATAPPDTCIMLTQSATPQMTREIFPVQ